MAASPATTVERQSSAAPRLSTNATDDEILGLTTNIRRKDLTVSQGRTGADVASQDQASSGKSAFSTGSLTAADPAGEPAHLQGGVQSESGSASGLVRREIVSRGVCNT